MITIKKNINRHWPNTNFIIIRYSEPNIKTPYLFSPEITKKFQENGIIVLDADEIVFGKTQKRLIGKEYKQEDVHPSALAFELLATKLAEKINKKEI